MTVPEQFLEMKRDFDALADDLKRAAEGRRIIYIGNPGNRGDALIRYGTKMFLQDHGLDHIEQSIHGPQGKAHVLPYLSPTFPEKVLFVTGGGGAWSGAYGGGYELAQMISRFGGKLFVLPSTFEFPLKGVEGTLYRRDKFQSKEAVPEAKFCHDMAFYAVIHRDELGFFNTPVTKPLGVYFRKDREARFQPGDLPEGNFDISVVGNHLDNADQFIRDLAASKVNLTDRLHVSIGTLAAKRRVFLMAGNYFKIRAIYESSMKPFFSEEITFADDNLSIAEFAVKAREAAEAA